MDHKLLAEHLLDEVMLAADEMVQMTCPAMFPLWLAASQKVRADLGLEPLPLPEAPPALLHASRATRSKYRALAGWRHVVVWKQVLDQVGATDPEAARACQRVYFQPYARNKPPFAYSQSVREMPGLMASEKRPVIKKTAADGAGLTIIAIGGLISSLARGPTHSPLAFHQEGFLSLGSRGTLRDVLKLEERLPVDWEGAG